jgi:hypothetical protein
LICKMADSYQILGSCAKIGGGSVAIGYTAGNAHTSGTGGMYLGYEAGLTNVSGTKSIGIGYSASPGSGTSSDIIAIGANAVVSASSGGIALGRDSVCTSANSIVLGSYVASLSSGPVIEEFGRGHQYFWTVTTANASLNLSGSAGAAKIIGGWIEFINLTANATMTLPNYSDLRPLMPNSRHNSCGELVVHNFGSTYEVTVVNGTNTIWADTSTISANTSQIVKYRCYDTNPYAPAVVPAPYNSPPYIEFYG